MTPDALDGPVAAVIRRRPVLVEPGDSLRSVAAHLWIDGADAAVVVDDEHVLGVVSAADVVVRLLAGADPDETRAGELVDGPVRTVRWDTPSRHAARQLVAEPARDLAVIDDTGALVGLVSAVDLLRPLTRPAGRDRKCVAVR